jgi:hypothetical protein
MVCMQIASETVDALKNAAKKLSGSEKRKFMAGIVIALGRGAQRAVSRQLNWCRSTIIKGQHEIRTGIECLDNLSARGRKKAEELNPLLIQHIDVIVENNAQADQSMNSDRTYLKITAPAVRQELKSRFGYTDDMLPSISTVNRKLNQNGYHLRKVRKTLPLKKFWKQTLSLTI